jgi:hypothetical protein
MRWEWEGGCPASVSERAEEACAEPAENTLSRPQPTNGRHRTRPVATVSSLPSEGWQGDDSEG